MNELFPLPSLICNLCGKPIGMSPKNPDIYDGFADAATKLYIHWNCRDAYYNSTLCIAGVFHEMPVTIHQQIYRNWKPEKKKAA